MRSSFIFRQDIYTTYINSFNDYALDIVYGGNVVIGDDIEDEWKNKSADDE